jgi:hypothetical protein
MKNLMVTLLTLTALTGCATQVPMYSVEQHTMPPQAKKLTQAEIGQRIRTALAMKEWSCSQETPTALICNLQRRTHKATVRIDYTQNYFSITNIGTVNLSQSEGMVHRNYNRWIKTMENHIVRAVAQ